MNAQLVPINPELISTIVFPEDFHTQITIPADAIKFQRSKEGTYDMCNTLIIVSGPSL